MSMIVEGHNFFFLFLIDTIFQETIKPQISQDISDSKKSPPRGGGGGGERGGRGGEVEHNVVHIFPKQVIQFISKDLQLRVIRNYDCYVPFEDLQQACEQGDP